MSALADRRPPTARTFRDLLPGGSWYRLPIEVRRRFSRTFEPGSTTCYRGRVVHTRLSWLGWWLAQLTRLIGAPLPLHADCGLATVVVTDHAGTGGQVWTRLYHTRSATPQAIQSIKRFAGATGLEEDLGYGFAMSLELSVTGEALVFTGHHYYWRGLGLSFELPGWLSPGVLRVKNWQGHQDDFYFSLELNHPWFGSLIEQTVYFDDEATYRGHAPAQVPGVLSAGSSESVFLAGC